MGKKDLEFYMSTNWIIKEPIDMELKEYLMLDYFQKIEKDLENKKLYPVFSELSLHLANLQTLLKQNQTLDTKRKLSSIDDEFTLYDLVSERIPELSDEKYENLREILVKVLPQFKKQFDAFKSLWTKVHDSIDIKIIKKNRFKNNLGFFYFTFNGVLYIFEYKNRKYKNIVTTKLNLIHKSEDIESKPQLIIKNYISNNKKSTEYSTFEVHIEKDFPLEETIIPIIKRKILSYLTQTKNLSSVVSKI
jgi:hypothetical protein